METIVTEFHFIRPWWLLAVIPSIAIAVGLLWNTQRQSQWHSLIDAKLLPYLIEGRISPKQKLPIIGLCFLWLIAILALAGPTWEKQPQPVQRDSSALVILWDLSPSMYAEDIKPSRLTRARLKLHDLLNTRKDGVTALIAYAGDAHVVTPLTDDTKTIKSMLHGLSPGVLPTPGSNPEQALSLANELLKETGVLEGDIVFLTDDIVYGALRELELLTADTRHRVTVWGIGTSEGSPIPIPDSGFAKNKQGEIVIAKVNHQLLSEAAIKMGGTYIPFSNDDSDIASIQHFGFKPFEQEESDTLRTSDEWIEYGQWLVIFCLPFAALMFRKGWILCLCLALNLYPSPSYALDLQKTWQGLWQTQDQQAQQLLKQNQTEEAADTFKDPEWKAIANYKTGNFDEAITHFQEGSSAQDKFNLGNALTQKGEYDPAIHAYKEALTLQPEFAEAQENLRIAEQLKSLSEQNQQNQDGQQQQDGEKQQGDESQESSQSQEQSQGEQGENSEQKNSAENQEGGEASDQKQQISEEESQSQDKQDALDKHYNQDGSDEEQDNKQALSPEEEKKDGEEGENEEQEKSTLVKPEDQNQDENDTDGEGTMMQRQMSPEEMEQQQSLEQWLRKVPDDPSGLLREKFRYEYNKRRRESFDRQLRSPDANENEERW